MYNDILRLKFSKIATTKNKLTLSLQASCLLTGPVHPAISATPPMQVLDLILIPSPQDAE